MFSGNQDTNLSKFNNLAVKNTFAMSFKKPIPMSGAGSRAFSASKGSIGGAIENPFLKKSVNLRES